MLKLGLAWEVGSDVGGAETEGRRLVEVDNVVGEVVELVKCDEAVRIEELGKRAVLAMLPRVGDIPPPMDTVVVEFSFAVEVAKGDEAVRIEELGKRAVPVMLPGMEDIPALMDTVVVEFPAPVEEELGARGVVFWLALGLAKALETKLAVEWEVELAAAWLELVVSATFSPEVPTR